MMDAIQEGREKLAQLTEKLAGRSFLRETGISAALVRELLGGEERAAAFARFFPVTGRFCCADIYAFCREAMNRISPEPADGWMKFTYAYACRILFPDPAYAEADRKYGAAARFYLAVMQFLFDEERKALKPEPFYDFVAEDGCRHTIWRISRDVAIGSLQLMFEQVPDAYIADGHHRCASAVAVCEERRAAARAAKTDGAAADAAGASNAGTTDVADIPTNAPGEEVAPYDRFLAVLFPASQLQIMPYDRVLTDAGGLTADEAIAAIRAAGFTVEPAEGVVDPQAHGEYGLKIEGRWYTVRLVGGRADDPAIDPVAKLDTAIAQDRILGPVFGIADPTRDSRISFVGGADAAEQADARAGQTGVALTLHATSMDQLMAVADAGRLMPPKSTWFEPKLLSGLFIRRI